MKTIVKIGVVGLVIWLLFRFATKKTREALTQPEADPDRVSF
jgi:hypothetical protein